MLRDAVVGAAIQVAVEAPVALVDRPAVCRLAAVEAVAEGPAASAVEHRQLVDLVVVEVAHPAVSAVELHQRTALAAAEVLVGPRRVALVAHRVVLVDRKEALAAHRVVLADSVVEHRVVVEAALAVATPAADVEALGIGKVTFIGDREVRIEYEPGEHASEEEHAVGRLVDWARASGLGLTDVRAGRSSLEQIFKVQFSLSVNKIQQTSLWKHRILVLKMPQSKE